MTLNGKPLLGGWVLMFLFLSLAIAFRKSDALRGFSVNTRLGPSCF